MSTALDRICADKRTHIDTMKAQTPLADLQAKIQDIPPARPFIRALSDHSPALICEVKKASPSKGVIRADFDPVTIAKTYVQAGAACLSVLTDIPYFQGHDSYFTQIRETVSCPLLRKDFMLNPYQIYESRALGADCILLIMAALETSQAQELYDLSTELGMDVLIEVHDMDELENALTLSPAMIGVNNRNLKTLDVSLETGLSLAAHIPGTVLKVAESGLATAVDIKRFQTAGYQAFLVGESLMREDDIGAAVKKLLC